VSEDVRVRGYFSKSKGGPRAKEFGKHWSSESEHVLPSVYSYMPLL
jgi:hypothetical protein